MKITSHVKPPINRHGYYSKIAKRMKIGDSILMKNVIDAGKLCVALKRLGFGAFQKSEPGGCRVWRIKK